MDDFLPYLPAEDEEGQGEGLLSQEGYARHCNNVESTGEWGSETEVSHFCPKVLFRNLVKLTLTHKIDPGTLKVLRGANPCGSSGVASSESRARRALCKDR